MCVVACLLLLACFPYMEITIKNLFTLKRINRAFFKCEEASRDTSPTQNYSNQYLFNNMELHDDLLSENYKVSLKCKFTIVERGKKREVEAPQMRDRIVQKILCEDVLVPQLVPLLVYDNYASIENRGTSMARKRIENDLYKFAREIDYDFENYGYVLLIDIHKFFESINPETLKSMLDMDLAVGNDIRCLIYYIIDNLTYNTGIGLNIGSELPQILAVYYLSKVDNYIKCVKGIKHYGRYMDDFRVFAKTKKELWELLFEIKPMLESLGLEINVKKTQIIAIKHGFTYLQTEYKFYKVDGKWKLKKSTTRAKITRERHRLKAHERLVESGEKAFDEVSNWYKSWEKSIAKDYNNKYAILNTRGYFNSLFCGAEMVKEKKSRIADVLELCETELDGSA